MSWKNHANSMAVSESSSFPAALAAARLVTKSLRYDSFHAGVPSFPRGIEVPTPQRHVHDLTADVSSAADGFQEALDPSLNIPLCKADDASNVKAAESSLHFLPKSVDLK